MYQSIGINYKINDTNNIGQYLNNKMVKWVTIFTVESEKQINLSKKSNNEAKASLWTLKDNSAARSAKNDNLDVCQTLH